jgi:hypothetical protein
MRRFADLRRPLPSATDLETSLQIVLVDHLGELDVPNWTY